MNKDTDAGEYAVAQALLGLYSSPLQEVPISHVFIHFNLYVFVCVFTFCLFCFIFGFAMGFFLFVLLLLFF